MAIVAVAVATAPPTSTAGLTKFSYRATSANVSAGEELVAAPAAGSNLNITRLRISSAVALACWLADDAATVLTQIYYFQATGGDSFIDIDFSHAPRIVADAKAIEIDATGAGQVSIEIEGFTSE
jgi:hypothetical protein